MAETPAPAPKPAPTTSSSTNIVTTIATAVVNFFKAIWNWISSFKALSVVGTGVKKTVSAVTLVTGVQHAASAVKVAFSPTYWYVGLAWVVTLLAVFILGHHEEAKKYTAVFGRLSSCMSSLSEAKKPVSVPVCVSAPAAPAASPVVAPAAPTAVPAPAPKAAVHHKKRKLFSTGLFG